MGSFWPGLNIFPEKVRNVGLVFCVWYLVTYYVDFALLVSIASSFSFSSLLTWLSFKKKYHDVKPSMIKVILQLAESGSFLVDMFKVRGKYASTDAYEDHFTLPKGRIVLVTHRRVILLQVSCNSFNQHVFLE